MSVRAFPILLVGVAACGAVGDYQYRPEQTNVSVAGMPGERYAIPPEAPTGGVRVSSSGVVDAQGKSGTEPAIHGRMVVDNEGDAPPWFVDLAEARLQVAGAGEAVPLAVNTDAQGQQVPVAQHQARTIDFFFPLPAGVTSADRLPTFDFLWTVHTPTRAIAERTTFTRYTIAPPPDEGPYAWGWGPAWWYGPWHPYVWWGPHVVVVRHHWH